MPHFNVKKPRFYPSKNLDILLNKKILAEARYQNSTNLLSTDAVEFINMNPYKTKSISTENNEAIEFIYNTGAELSITSQSTQPRLGMNYFSILGHNAGTANFIFKLYGVRLFNEQGNRYGPGTEPKTPIPVKPLLNCTVINTSTDANSDDNWILPSSIIDPDISDEQLEDYTLLEDKISDGTCIVEIENDYLATYRGQYIMIVIKPINELYASDVEIGSFCWGTYYDMPSTPNLNYSMDIIHDGVETTKTVGGSTLTNISFSRKPEFLGRLDGFGIENGNTINGTGRLSWKLSFSSLKSEFENFFDDTTGYLFPRGAASNSEYKYGNDFYNRVLGVTLGGQLPFIFEYDNSVNETNAPIGQWQIGQHNENHFCLAKFKSNKITFRHRNYKMYDITLDIEESW